MLNLIRYCYKNFLSHFLFSLSSHNRDFCFPHRSKARQQPKPKALLCFPILQEGSPPFSLWQRQAPYCSPPPTFPENEAIEAPFVCGKREGCLRLLGWE